MVGHIVAALRQSTLVKDLEVTELVEEDSVQFLRVKAEMRDGSLLYVRELFVRDQSKYSYHWQTQTGALLLRWDNAPHHPEIPTFPHHKHEGERVSPSVRVTVEEVLAALAKRLQKRGQGT
jgi:Family of unknown function (DUF6516)